MGGGGAEGPHQQAVVAARDVAPGVLAPGVVRQRAAAGIGGGEERSHPRRVLRVVAPLAPRREGVGVAEQAGQDHLRPGLREAAVRVGRAVAGDEQLLVGRCPLLEGEGQPPRHVLAEQQHRAAGGEGDRLGQLDHRDRPGAPQAEGGGAVLGEVDQLLALGLPGEDVDDRL